MNGFLISRSLGILVAAGIVLSGCTTVLNRYKPFSDYVGKEVELKRPCVLEVYIAAKDGMELYSFWENDKPTELVFDDRMFTHPARVFINEIGQEWKLYSASGYAKKLYYLRESELWSGANRNNYGGPYRIFELPAGTKIFIERAYTFNGIDSISHRVNGVLTIPGTTEQARFTYSFSNGKSAHGTMNDYITRAPWEDETVPEERYIGWKGDSYE